MQLRVVVAVVAVGLSIIPASAQMDILTVALTSDLTAECKNNVLSGFCAGALRYHGQGKNDKAMETLSTYAPAQAKSHYKIAQSRPNDGFWKLVAEAGANPIDCDADLSATLNRHFLSDAEALSKADDDAAKNSFLALADLLQSIPAGPNRDPDANVYRFCFADADHLFSTVKRKLGR